MALDKKAVVVRAHTPCVRAWAPTCRGARRPACTRVTSSQRRTLRPASHRSAWGQRKHLSVARPARTHGSVPICGLCGLTAQDVRVGRRAAVFLGTAAARVRAECQGPQECECLLECKGLLACKGLLECKGLLDHGRPFLAVGLQTAAQVMTGSSKERLVPSPAAQRSAGRRGRAARTTKGLGFIGFRVSPALLRRPAGRAQPPAAAAAAGRRRQRQPSGLRGAGPWRRRQPAWLPPRPPWTAAPAAASPSPGKARAGAHLINSLKDKDPHQLSSVCSRNATRRRLLAPQSASEHQSLREHSGTSSSTCDAIKPEVRQT